MSAAELLRSLRAGGLTVEADGERLKVGPSERLTDAHREAIRAHRAELLDLLAGRLHLLPPADWPLPALLAELAGLRRLRAELVAAGCPPHALESCDAEILRFALGARRCENCRRFNRGKADDPPCLLLHLGSCAEPARGWLAAPERPNGCEHFEAPH